jgi:hypothetical protein
MTTSTPMTKTISGVPNDDLMPIPYRARVQRIQTSGGPVGQMRETIRRIGAAIKRASVYPPIRNHAAAIASTAPPKDFLGQLQAVYNDFIRRWRYVKDPRHSELLTNSPEAIWKLTMAGDGIGVGLGKGAGDCDCATAALGAELEAIGFDVRIGTTANAGSSRGPLFGHVFIQAHVPHRGWMTLDPVLHPKHPCFATAPHSRIAYWNLDGQLLGYHGNYVPHMGQQEDIDMDTPHIDQWANYGFGEVEDETTGSPQEWSSLYGYDEDSPGLIGWGDMVGEYGMLGADEMVPGMAVEVDESDQWEPGVYRTPMIQLAVDDYQYVARNGMPYHGMLGLADTGEIYAYDGTLGRGFFRKLFRKVKKKVRKVAKRIKHGIKKVLKKSKFGRFLLKIGGKIKKIAMKIVRPLMKFVGKWAAKLAPIAAMIPGYGTAIAGALAAAGKVANMMKKWGVSTKGKPGKVRGLHLKNPKKLPGFQRELKAQAAKMARLKRSNPRRFRELSTKLARQR